jgi:hypothetical protein
MASRRLLGLLANLSLACGAAALVAALAESALRLTGWAPAAFQHTNRIANGRRTILLDCYPSNPRGELDIDLRDAETRTRYRAQGILRVDEAARLTPFAVERRYNSAGFRGPEVPPRRAGVVRIGVIGDSFTEGMGVREADTYPAVLGRLLEQAEPGRFEVFNFGKRGWDFPALYDTFLDVQRFEPDFVIYGMVINDAERTGSFQAQQEYLNDWILDRGRMFRGREDAPDGLWSLRLAALARDAWGSYRVGATTTRWYREMYGAPNREGWERTQAHLREMNRQMQVRGRRFLVALWPLLVGLESRYPFAEVEATIEQFCLEAGIPFRRLRTAFDGRKTSSLWVHPVDRHPNALAHRLAAESLARLLLDRKEAATAR